MFLLVGGGYAYWSYKQNLPSPIWVPIPMNHELPLEQREKFAKELKAKIATPEILNQVSQDLDLAAKWKLANTDAATAELKKRLFVRAGEMDSPGGKVPSMNIGVEGPRKDNAISQQIAMRVMDDVWKIIGIKPPPKR
ncbi:hypothetical protein GCM10023212_38450 [Luteolibacter yonseiensis]